MAAAPNKVDKPFVVYIAALVEQTTMPIYSFYYIQVALLSSEETRISAKYSDFFNVFSLGSMTELLEYIRINDPYINLLNNKQLPYSLIYNLGLVKLEMLKTYIKPNLASSLIRFFKSPLSARIIFV